MNTHTSLITEVAADVLAHHRHEAADGELPALWSTLVDLDWPGVGVPAEIGGADGSLADLATLLSTAAEHGVGIPLLEGSLGRWVLAHAGRDARSSLVLCATEEAPRRVPWARHASHLVAWEAGSAFLVDLGHPGARIEHGLNLAGEPRDDVVLDEGVSRVALPQAPSRSAARARSALLNAVALTGAARGAYDLSRAHVKQREQFGRPLLALKSVSTQLASMSTELAAAEAACARALNRGEPDVHAIATAKIAAATTATSIARAAHQLHGAIGVTHEHPLHHRTRKLWAWRDEYGGQRKWAIELGGQALDLGEIAVWDQITAPG